MNIAYVRDSTITEQNDTTQTNVLEKYGIDKWFKDNVSCKDKDRPELKKMLDYVREGDTYMYIILTN